ncbi:SMI1/KNR4 family protein [Streptomyces microflavus]|uniref:SMI1/KNR4 family protein n=1 Tax=Streptomyces TaxID=1883 RepID=UPI001C5A590F|nr:MULTISPECIES: SMI1/KNR4 family protein [unclassified Streptomyces]MBW3362109.1 SMI1/KNR4 family protein [Streptomyces sp. 09ZI22]MEE1731331.1 SMI1/KNR4 family protein [Streptomyces sp. BE282]
MTDLKRLTSICPPPVRDARRDVSLQDGRGELPSNHRHLIETYGVGCFDEFLWIHGDSDENPHLDLWTQTGVARSILAEQAASPLRAQLATLGVTPESLVKWGTTDNGDWLLWVPTGRPDSWPTIILEVRQRDLLLVSRTSTGVILDLLTGQLTTPIFPEDFPSDHPDFSTNPYST